MAEQIQAQAILATLREPLIILDANLRVHSANRAFYESFKVAAGETEGFLIYELGNGQWDIPALRALLEEIVPQNSELTDYSVEHDFPDIGHRIMLLNAKRVEPVESGPSYIVLAFEDITERHRAKQELQAEHERIVAELERERRITSVLQRPLLIETPEDAFPGLEVATLFWPASDEADVGGDFHDAFALADGRLAFVIGDATGSGLTAAARAVEVRDLFRAMLRMYPPYLSQAFTRLNDALCDAQILDDRSLDTLMALAAAAIDIRRSVAVCAWAGIDPPLVVRANGSVEVLRGGGLLLGVSPKELFAEAIIDFGPGDILMMSTDGLTEARRGKEFFGQERMIAAVKEMADRPSVRDIAMAVYDQAKSFAGELEDDACLVLVRRVG